MDNECKDCGPFESFPHYRVVQSVYERNMIPCDQRVNGMMITVVGNDRSYKQYMLRGGDPCVNDNWKEITTEEDIWNMVGHATVFEDPGFTITSEYLNSRYPKSREGFRVTFITLNSTFMRVAQDVWMITNFTTPIPYLTSGL